RARNPHPGAELRRHHRHVTRPRPPRSERALWIARRQLNPTILSCDQDTLRPPGTIGVAGGPSVSGQNSERIRPVRGTKGSACLCILPNSFIARLGTTTVSCC